LRRFSFEISPMAAPRINHRSRFSQKAKDYWDWTKTLRDLAHIQGFRYSQSEIFSLSFTFMVPMPNSWSKKKKREMEGKPHKSKPDLDNFLKATIDGLFPGGDHMIASLHGVHKIWREKGRIDIEVYINFPRFHRHIHIENAIF